MASLDSASVALLLSCRHFTSVRLAVHLGVLSEEAPQQDSSVQLRSLCIFYTQILPGVHDKSL